MTAAGKAAGRSPLAGEVERALRLHAVQAVARGCSVAEVAAVFGRHPRTVFRWVSAFAARGPDALLAKPRPGRPRSARPPAQGEGAGVAPARPAAAP
ncbi:helix-turn-helix domain-containing protein [Bordetella sp. 2513F-2]